MTIETKKYEYKILDVESLKKSKRLRLCRRISLILFKILLLLLFIVYVIVPIAFKYSYKFQTHIVFLNYVHLPFNANYTHPETYGLPNSRNFYLQTEDDMKLGVWQMLPNDFQEPSNKNDIKTKEEYFEKALGNGQDVIIYMHGNAGSRLTGHRIELYKILRKYFHVIAFDYRSYGDSTNDSPSEDKLVSDSIFMYNWVANRTKGNVYVWGHSLGTSIALHSLSILRKRHLQPKGIVLEAPFNNMREEVSEFPLAKFFRFLPWFESTITQPLVDSGFTFESDRFICRVDSPILILHAEDDNVVPFKLGKKLFEEAKRCRRENQGNVVFYRFEGKHKYSHKNIYKAPDLETALGIFIRGTKKKWSL
ncbi:unnamed protein product [Phyllotreta striolata]|uniref:Serine aminopeptidase S33 domain-containing protein n=1 Tax=Phyllotreta striolata TaxID=444603 RepID=A0A9N9TH06_PHYSR|nr:unnamed protein product [Phyllotreta striolata]